MDKEIEKNNFQVKSWNRFVSRNLAISCDIIGKKHCFKYDDAIVSIHLPGSSDVNRGEGYDQMITIGTRKADTDKILTYKIEKIDVEVELKKDILLNKEVLNKNANAFELIIEEEQTKLDEVAERHKEIAERAYRYWLSILRWVVDDYRIGRAAVLDHNSGWGTHLKTTDTNHTVWLQSTIILVSRYETITTDHWQEAQQKLNRLEDTPVYISLKHDAEEYFYRGEYRRSLIDMAVSCETFLRSTVLRKLPNNLQTDFVTMIEEANIHQYINKFFKNLIREEDRAWYKKIKKDIESLFDKRNKVVHMGSEEGLNKEKCERYLNTTKELLTYDKKINNN